MSANKGAFVAPRRWLAYLSAVGMIGAIGATAVSGSGAGASAARQPVANPANPAPAVIPADRMAASQQAILSYWTAGRMASAKPAQLTMSGASAKNAKAENAGNTATGNPGLAGGLVPAGLEAGPAQTGSINKNGSSSSVLPADGGYPGPNDTYNWMGSQSRVPRLLHRQALFYRAERELCLLRCGYLW